MTLYEQCQVVEQIPLRWDRVQLHILVNMAIKIRVSGGGREGVLNQLHKTDYTRKTLHHGLS